MANSTIVCRDVSTTHELTENHPLQSNLPFLAAGMRPRGLSLRSAPPMPTVPENTPATTNSAAASVTGVSSTGSIGERLIRPATARLEYLQHERPGTFWEQDTTVPNNTPVSTNNLRPVTQGLPDIEDFIPRLPPRRDARPTDGANDVDHESVHSLNISSLRGEYDTPSPNTVCAPPPTPATRPANSLMTSPMATNKAELADPFEPSKPTIISKSGVLEFNDWEGEVEDMMVSALARLGQLAVDKAKKDSSVTAEEYYRRKLAKIINDPSRRFNAGKFDVSNVRLPSIAAEHPILSSPTRAEVRIMDLRLGLLEEKVEQLMEFKEATTKVSKSANSETEHLDEDADDEQGTD